MNSIQSGDEDFSICNDPQFVSSHKFDDIVRSNDNFLTRSFHTQRD